MKGHAGVAAVFCKPCSSAMTHTGICQTIAAMGSMKDLWAFVKCSPAPDSVSRPDKTAVLSGDKLAYRDTLLAG